MPNSKALVSKVVSFLSNPEIDKVKFFNFISIERPNIYVDIAFLAEDYKLLKTKTASTISVYNAESRQLITTPEIHRLFQIFHSKSPIYYDEVSCMDRAWETEASFRLLKLAHIQNSIFDATHYIIDPIQSVPHLTLVN